MLYTLRAIKPCYSVTAKHVYYYIKPLQCCCVSGSRQVVQKRFSSLTYLCPRKARDPIQV